MTSDVQVGVVGAGATGGYLAGRLAHAGVPVTLFGRGDSAEIIRQQGVRIIGPSEEAIVARPGRVVRFGESIEPVDLTIFCVKSYDTDEAARQSAAIAGAAGFVLCLQNGVENEDILSRYFERRRVLPGVLYIGAERVAPGVIRCSSPPRILFGVLEQDPAVPLERFKAVFAAAGIECAIDDQILASKWQKFVFNCGLNPLTALTGRKLGEILATRAGAELFAAVIDEAIAVGRALGAPFRGNIKEAVNETARRMNISSSMTEDLAAGRRMELEAFSGFVCRRGGAKGVPTPVTGVLHRLLEIAGQRQVSDSHG